MTYRPEDALAERLRTAAFVTRRSKQSILDEALSDWLDGKGQVALAEYRAEQAKKPRRA
jgi:predicted transcriptional regulator